MQQQTGMAQRRDQRQHELEPDSSQQLPCCAMRGGGVGECVRACEKDCSAMRALSCVLVLLTLPCSAHLATPQKALLRTLSTSYRSRTCPGSGGCRGDNSGIPGNGSGPLLLLTTRRSVWWLASLAAPTLAFSSGGGGSLIMLN